MPQPVSTYRLQFHAGFTFREAAAIVPYLCRLGISHVYASPYLKARPGSTHGYDVLDHCKLNPELGTQEDFDFFLGALDRHGMSHIVDIVPNHVGVATNDNAWWNDVLRNGPASKYASYFDIQWGGSRRPEMRDKVLLPVLGAPYGEVLEKGELKLVYEGGKYFIAYYDRRFPLSPQSEELIASNFDSPALAIAHFNSSPRHLHELLEPQHYRLAWWRTAADEINYRRFFDINELAALAQENEEVFGATHEFILKLVRQGKISGLRIDHPDGLYDPKEYLDRLAAEAGEEGALYIVVEKILALNESLPEDWAVAGTTGYDFLNHVNLLFVESANAEAMSRIYAELTGQSIAFEELVYQKKKLILEISLASELHMLARRLDALAQRDNYSRDFTFLSLLKTLRETIACFGVYRTYITSRGAGPVDQQQIEAAIDRAIARNPWVDPSVFHFLRDSLLLKFGADELRPCQLEFAGKFQQLTAPATAKGIEDTAFYVYNRLVSLNEVGGDPAVFGLPPADLHDYLIQRQQRWPGGLSCLSTHDTKRGEDVRARLNILSELPEEWGRHVGGWFKIAATFLSDKSAVPSRNDQYLLFQTLVGAWPLDQKIDGVFISRITSYMQKAMREAKVHTSWTSPDSGYEAGMADLIRALVGDSSFLRDFLPFQSRIARLGLFNSLSQTLLRLAAPGVPDTYQGTELVDLSLVDPDNRRAVDYALREGLLGELASRERDGSLAGELVESMADGRIKLFLTWKVLNHRRAHPEFYMAGSYLPARIEGPRERHAFAFLRQHRGMVAMVVVPRLLAQGLGEDEMPLGGFWEQTNVLLPSPLPAVRNILTGERIVGERQISLAAILRTFPVALLASDG